MPNQYKSHDNSEISETRQVFATLHEAAVSQLVYRCQKVNLAWYSKSGIK